MLHVFLKIICFQKILYVRYIEHFVYSPMFCSFNVYNFVKSVLVSQLETQLFASSYI